MPCKCSTAYATNQVFESGIPFFINIFCIKCIELVFVSTELFYAILVLRDFVEPLDGVVLLGHHQGQPGLQKEVAFTCSFVREGITTEGGNFAATVEF